MDPFSALGGAIVRGLNAAAKHEGSASMAGMLQRPTDPAPDATPLMEVDQISATVTRCINAIAEDASNQAPLKLYDVSSKVNGRDAPKEVIDHPAIELWRHINPVDTACIYKQQMYADLLVEGNHYGWLDIQNGLPVNMIRMPPHNVSVVPDKRRIIAGYTWKTPDGQSDYYDANLIVHVRTRNPDSIYRGLGLLPRLREQIIMDRALRQYKLNQIRNGVPTTLLMKVKRGFNSEEDMERHYDEMWQRSRGPGNAGKPFWVRDADVDIEALPRPTEDEVALLENLRYTRNEIAMLFGVPPSRLSDYSQSFRSSASEQGRTFLQDTIMAWHRLFEDYLNSTFLPRWFPKDSRRLRFSHDYSGVPALALAMRDMATVQEIKIRNAIQTPNQGAVNMGDAAHDNDAADELYMNGKKLGAEPEPNPAQPPGQNTEPGSIDPPRDDGDGEEPDEEQEEAERVFVTRGGSDVDVKSMWLACGILKKSEETSDGARRIYGIASTDSVDRQKTIVDQESLRAAASRWKKQNGKVFYNHEWNSLPMGRAIAVDFENGAMMLGTEIGRDYDIVTGFWGLSKTPVNDVWTAIEQKMVSSYSIAFNADKIIELDEDGEQKGPTVLKVTDLFEVSVVSIAANPDAEFGIVKAMSDPTFAKRIAPQEKPEFLSESTSASASAQAIEESPLRFALAESEEDEVDWDRILKEMD